MGERMVRGIVGRADAQHRALGFLCSFSFFLKRKEIILLCVSFRPVFVLALFSFPSVDPRESGLTKVGRRDGSGVGCTRPTTTTPGKWKMRGGKKCAFSLLPALDWLRRP
jgi:hypothetical protein